METWIEKRQHSREAIRIAGTAVLNNGLLREPVLIVNLSRSGAMVEVSEATALPEDFTLLFRHSIEPCRLVWRVGRLAGIEFDQPTS